MSFGRLFRQSRIPALRTAPASVNAPSKPLVGSVQGKGKTLEYGLKHSHNPRQPKLVSVASLDWFGLGTDYRTQDMGFARAQEQFSSSGIALDGPPLLQHASRSNLSYDFVKWCSDRGVKRSALDGEYLVQLAKEYASTQKCGPWDTISTKPIAGPSYFPRGSLHTSRNGVMANPMLPARIVDDQRTKAACIGVVASCEVNDSSIGHHRDKIVMMEVKGAKMDNDKLVMKLQTAKKASASVWKDYTGSQKLQRMHADSNGHSQHKKYEKLFDLLQ
ncbi:hypothetical protein CJU89_0620 [Yarrowia sp. B02]|nr:hypothetical protein CJU89_0620 [Yarrowia sp. B02]